MLYKRYQPSPLGYFIGSIMILVALVWTLLFPSQYITFRRLQQSGLEIQGNVTNLEVKSHISRRSTRRRYRIKYEFSALPRQYMRAELEHAYEVMDELEKNLPVGPDGFKETLALMPEKRIDFDKPEIYTRTTTISSHLHRQLRQSGPVRVTYDANYPRISAVDLDWQVWRIISMQMLALLLGFLGLVLVRPPWLSGAPK